ncbi:MAG: DUF2062 domain-containing protein [Pseudomonadales bacterium]|nr:DUF2062 domain-containing protein [Pseudomonadales bacterium]
MPRKALKRIMPNKDQVMQGKSMQLISALLHRSGVWHFNRRYAARAVLIGVFCAFIPLPMQMFIAAIICILVKANLPLSIACVWITNPLTIAPIFYTTYRLGAFILDVPVSDFEIELSVRWAQEELGRIWKPLILGSVICGTAFSALAYTTVDLLWRWSTVKRWQNREHRHRKK